MKPRSQLSLYPLKGGRLWIVLTGHDMSLTTTTLDADDAAAFRRL